MLTQPRKLWPYVIAAVFVIFLVQSPQAAALIVSGTLGVLERIADAISAFVTAL